MPKTFRSNRASSNLIWSCRFTGATEVAKLGGTLTGSPSFAGREGLVLDGATQYVTFPMLTEWNSLETTVKIRFTPYTAFDAASVIYLLDSTDDQIKLYNTGTGSLRLERSNVLLNTGNLDATKWIINRPNTSIAATKSTSSSLWSNSQSIFDSAFAFTPQYTSSHIMYVGSAKTGSNLFNGIIHELSIYDGKWTADDVANDYGHATYNYSNKASLYLDMASATEGYEQDGQNVLVDWNMEKAGVADWTQVSSATITKSTDNPYSGKRALRLTSTGGGAAKQDVLVVGQQYRIRGWCRGDGSSGALPRLYESGTLWTGTNSTTWQHFDIVHTAAATGILLYVIGVSGWVEFDDITIIPSGQLLNDGDMEMEGTDEWTATNCTQSKVPVVGGPAGATQALQIVSTGAGSRTIQGLLTIGRTYRLTGWGRGDGTNLAYVGSSFVTVWTGNASTEWEYFDVTFVAPSTDVRLRSAAAGAGGVAEFTLVDVREVYQTVDDKAKQGIFVKRGDGRGNNAPTFNNPGFVFDGSTDYINVSSLQNELDAPEQTFVFAVSPAFAFGDAGTYSLFCETTLTNNRAYFWSSGLLWTIGGTNVFNTAWSSMAGNFKQDGLTTIIASFSSGSSDLYMGDEKIASSALAFTPSASVGMYISGTTLGSNEFDGIVYYFSWFPFKMSELQVKELTQQLMSRYGRF